MKNYVSLIFGKNQPFTDRTAIVDDNGRRRTSWAELYEKSCAVASYARSAGLKGVVPVCMPRCAETVEVLLGLGLAGLGVAPLSDHTPEARIRIIEGQSGNSVWTWTQYKAAVHHRAYDFAPVYFEDGAPAYVVYTSGSTGTPKGVILPNDTVEKSYKRMASSEFLDLHEGDVVLQNASFSFVALMIDLFAPLYAGCVTHILPESARTDIDLMTRYIQDHGITSMFITPKPLSRLGNTPSLKVVCVGGERVTGLGPKGYRLLNVWGMSETAALALGYEITEPMSKTPIGKSMGDFRCYIIDENGESADEGELCLSGATASGYYKRPDLNEQFFEPNPFCADEGHRVLMHTGDIVRRLGDGNLLYLNRRDFMVKINGQRVEPGEVETVLERIEGVKGAAVKGFTEEDGHSYLCAYYVTDTDLDETGIRAELGKYLTEYMIPAFYQKLDALPLNSNGKLDRAALTAPEISERRSEYAEPENDRERALCRAFEIALKTERVGVNDDFYRLGGDSIRAMSVVSLAGLPGLNTAMVLSGKTPREIAEIVDGRSEDVFEGITARPDRSPLTDSQMGIYLECAASPESVKYNIPFAVSFEREEDMNCESVKNCVNRVISVHPALYSRIFAEDEIFMCRCDMPQDGICSVTETSEKNIESEWDDFLRPFRLEESPLCRARAVLTKKRVHVLFDTHHIVSDGSSVASLIRELSDALAGRGTEAESVDAFALYDALKRSELENAERADTHFAALLGGVETDSNLLPDHKSTLTDAPAERVILTIDGIDLSHLHRHGITESSFFMGVFGYTLAKMTGQTDCLFAAAESGRKSAKVRNTVCMMVRTLPVYMQIDEKEPASELLKALQQQFRASIANDTASFAELCREYGVSSDVMFVYQSDLLSGEDTALGKVDVDIRPTGRAISNFNASVFKIGQTHKVVFEYRSDLYDRETIERFGEVFRNTAAAFAADTPLQQIPLLNERDKKFLDALNATESPYNPEETILDIFRRRVSEQPDKIALIYKDRSYTYRQADEISDRIAAYIASLGIGRGQTVSVLIPRCEYLFLASMGIMKAGAMYQPLDPSYPAERLSFMRKDADSALLIAERNLLPMLTDFGGRVLYLDEIPMLPAGKAELVPPCAEDGYVLLYTSGTTGLPKGCMLKHGNLTAMVHAYAKLTEMQRESIGGAYASYGFDAHMADMYPIISCGGTLVIVPDEIRLDLAAVKDYCESNRVTHFILTTQLAVQFALQYRRLEHLQCLVAGGEKMVSIEPPVSYRLMNCYGPTECTVLETEFTVDSFYDDIPIGTAIANTKLYVVDGENRRVPVGVPGELIIAGPQVGKEYLNRPEKTAETFVGNIFDESANGEYRRCYRTGDIVRFRPDGNLVFIGRRDMQVKIRGFRIELSEVERVIMDYPGVRNATVTAVDAPAGGKCLNAYIVGDEAIDIGKLNAYILSVKPPYMVPAATMQIDSIPLTVNGKVDKRKLPHMEVHFDDVTRPETELQQKIFDKVSQVVGTEAFGIHTDLYMAGLSSLGSIRLCSLLAEEFGIPVQIRNLKKHSTIAGLEEFVLSSRKEDTASPSGAAPVEATVRYGVDYPISKTMEGIFAECAARPDSTFYNIPYLLKLSPEIDEHRLKAALVQAVEAHPYMKTELFTDTDGQIRQHRRKKDAFTTDMIRSIFTDSIDSVRDGLVHAFPITNGKLFEITLIHSDALYLFLNFHHILADGTSIGIFLSDAERAYAGETLREEQYSGFDVAEEERRARTTEELAEARDYYVSLLEGLDRDFLPLPDRYADTPPSCGKLSAELAALDMNLVRGFCDKNRVSLNAFFVSVFGFVLSRYAGTDYSVFNTVYNGRNDSRAADTFAMLVKTLPVVCMADKKSVSELTAEISAQLMDSMAYDLYSYGEIARSLDVNNDVMFIYQGDGFERNSFCGFPAEELQMELSDAKAPLVMQIILKNGNVLCELEYDPGRFTERLMSAFVSAYETACTGFASEKLLSEVSLLSGKAEAEMERYNETEREYDRSETITGLFLENVRKYPDKLCVSYRDTSLTYSEVGTLSGKIALFLMDKGIGAGDVVPILIDRTENMVVTAHGVVRSGAAYLGLDPGYPTDRLEFMIRDSGARCILAERRLMERIPGYDGTVLYTDDIDALPELTENTERELRAEPRHRITPDNDALYVYSSGTTGLPKGSILQHKAIVCFYHNYIRNSGMDESSRIATYASFGFDGGAQDVFSVPMRGASLYVIPDDIRLDLGSLERFYTQNEISIGFMTTQVGSMFMAHTRCPSLRYFMVGGEKLIPVLPPEWVTFQNGYGPSETMCYVNRYTIRDTERVQPIGKTSDNIKEYVIDRFGNRLPFGACGELCISGGQMGRGYHNRPEKTTEAFVANPFCRKEGYTRMYRSGDIVRMLPDGNYDFVGRRDGQVKIRGFRVELSEVEMQIRKFPGIQKTVVTAFDNLSGGKYLAAYAVCEGTLDIDALKAFIRSEKPDYMIPAAIVQLDEIPLTSNGKVDMRKLPKAELGSVQTGTEPADETEKKLCCIFADVLGLGKVYADDDFFAIGGSSISAIQVIVRCEQAGMSVVYKNLFANPTPRQLASFLRGGREVDISALDLERGDGHDYSALSYNVLSNLPKIRYDSVGDVLLTGATGFLGSHIFRELLSSTDGRVICLVRSKAGLSAEERLQMMMVYYFEEWYRNELGERVTVVDADMEDDDVEEKLKSIRFDTIINCAANVKHFAAGDELMGANFSGVEKLIALAEKTNARLIQISSLSVCGESVNGSVPAGYVFKETDLNIGQSLENKYIYTKYLAEQAVIDAVSRKRVRGKVIRLGNLMARFDDSEFQVNAGTNGFLRMFMGFHALGCFPMGMMDAEIEFSPIDSVAKAVVMLSGTPDEFTVFHAKNCNSIHYGHFINAIRTQVKPIEIVEDDEFDERLNKALEDEKNAEKLGGLLAYRNGADSSLADSLKFYDESDAGRDIRVKIGSDTTFTGKALYRLGFAWPLISSEYLTKMVETLVEMNYFTDN